jgi:hypothetical protein
MKAIPEQQREEFESEIEDIREDIKKMMQKYPGLTRNAIQRQVFQDEPSLESDLFKPERPYDVFLREYYHKIDPSKMTHIQTKKPIRYNASKIYTHIYIGTKEIYGVNASKLWKAHKESFLKTYDENKELDTPRPSSEPVFRNMSVKAFNASKKLKAIGKKITRETGYHVVSIVAKSEGIIRNKMYATFSSGKLFKHQFLD